MNNSLNVQDGQLGISKSSMDPRDHTDDRFSKIEGLLLEATVRVTSFEDIKTPLNPSIFFIEKYLHAVVVFPNGKIFNCNPRDCPLPIALSDRLEKKQIEPPLGAYEEYWDAITSRPNIIENDQNCIFWSAYYLWWSLCGNGRFLSSLPDLERWLNDDEKIDEVLSLIKTRPR